MLAVIFGNNQKTPVNESLERDKIMEALKGIPYESLSQGVKIGDDLIKDVQHDPSESCQSCGSYSHNTWYCWNN